MSTITGNEPSPGARSFAQLKNEVARFVKMPDDPEALRVAGDCIREAVRYYNSKVWRALLVYQDIPLVADSPNYDLSNQVREPRYAELLDANGYSVGRVAYLDPRTFLEASFPITGSGSPCRYTIMNMHAFGTVQLDYAPTVEFIAQTPTMRLWHYRAIQHPTSDSEDIGVPSHIEGGIVRKAKVEIAMVYDPKKYEMAVREHERTWMLLRADHSEESHDWN